MRPSKPCATGQHSMQLSQPVSGHMTHSQRHTSSRTWTHLQEALQRLEERIAAGRATPAMCRSIAVAAMRLGDMLAADAALAADDAVCERSGRPRQLDTWAQVIRLQVGFERAHGAGLSLLSGPVLHTVQPQM